MKNRNITVRYDKDTHLTSDTGDAVAKMEGKPPAGTPIWPLGGGYAATVITELRAGHASNVLRAAIGNRSTASTYPPIITGIWVDAVIKALRGSGEPGTSYKEIKEELERMAKKHKNQAETIGDLDSEIADLNTQIQSLTQIGEATIKAKDNNFTNAINERNAAEDQVKSLKKEHAVSMFDHISSMTKERDAQALQIEDMAGKIINLNKRNKFLQWHVDKGSGSEEFAVKIRVQEVQIVDQVKQITNMGKQADRHEERITLVKRERDKWKHAYDLQKQAEQYRADNALGEAVPSTITSLEVALEITQEKLKREEADHTTTKNTLEHMRQAFHVIRGSVNDAIGEDDQ